MRRTIGPYRLLPIIGLALAGWCTIAAQGQPPIKAGTPSGQQLHAPEDRDSFDFMVFGDRTGGPAEGIEVLKEAVQMANRMDVDLVLTVGDLVQGYNQPAKWLEQMGEYKAVMNVCRMPWYPVPGNHDVYSRPKKPGGHTDLYTEHFGPLYYSFDYKWAHFIVLFSDEAHSFADPARNQNMSPQQLDWLRRDLAGTEAELIFVFLHHPRWIDYYDGCNWPDVHGAFVDDGRPVTVFAGHIHLYRSDGWIDNVRYYTLATTGGGLQAFQETASLHHVDFVRVRPEGSTVAVLPVGSVLDGDFVLGHELDAMYELSKGGWVEIRGQAAIGLEAGEQSALAVSMTNPTDRTLHVTARLETDPGWKLNVAPVDVDLLPGQTHFLSVGAVAPALGESPPNVTVHAVADYALNSGLVQPVRVRVQVPTRVSLPESLVKSDSERNGVLSLNGSSAVRLDAPGKLERYTLECWARGDTPGGTVALLAKTQNSAYGLFWSDKTSEQAWPVGYAGTGDGYLTLPAAEPWEWDRWTHLALVFDGRQATFYVDGRPQATKKSVSAATHNDHPLYVGADPDHRGEPGRFFRGQVDEVRLSAVARYDAAFEPQRTFERDDKTVLLLHFDQVVGALHPDDSGNDLHGWAAGQPRIERSERPQ